MRAVRIRRIRRNPQPTIPIGFRHDGNDEIRLGWAEWGTRGRQAAGLPGRWVHDFRRSCVRRMERKGVPRSWAMKLTGHRGESIYRRYAIVSESDLAEGVARLAAPNEPQAVAQGYKAVVPFPQSLDKVRTKQGQK